jgi:NAD(P)H-nitrite reductase large subunit
MRYVIIGSSAAGLSAGETLRRYAPKSAITLISDEAHPPYSRPLLTYLLSGEVRLEKVWLRGADYFKEWGFEALLGETVLQVDPKAHEVRLASDKVIPYDRLLMASGARPRLLGIPGEDLEGVYTLRTLADWRRLDAALPLNGPVTVVGAGAVGLKAAEALAHRGHRVTLLEAADRPLPRMLDDTAAGLLTKALESLNIETSFNTKPVAILGNQGRVRGLSLADGRELPAALVLLAVGVTPNVEFLTDPILAPAGGLLVDAALATGAPDIFAAGDCACPPHFLTGEPAYYPIWPGAVAQGRVAGANMAGAGLRYEGLLPQNSISLRGLHVITGGLGPQETGDCRILADLDERRGQYRRLAFKHERLVGLTLVGDVNDAGIYFKMMEQQTPFQEPLDPGQLWG